MTDVKLGILLWSQAASWNEMLDAAKRVDRLGLLLPGFAGGAGAPGQAEQRTCGDQGGCNDQCSRVFFLGMENVHFRVRDDCFRLLTGRMIGSVAGGVTAPRSGEQARSEHCSFPPSCG
jgi:hypothetical protein